MRKRGLPAREAAHRSPRQIRPITITQNTMPEKLQPVQPMHQLLKVQQRTARRMRKHGLPAREAVHLSPRQTRPITITQNTMPEKLQPVQPMHQLLKVQQRTARRMRKHGLPAREAVHLSPRQIRHTTTTRSIGVTRVQRRPLEDSLMWISTTLRMESRWCTMLRRRNGRTRRQHRTLSPNLPSQVSPSYTTVLLRARR